MQPLSDIHLEELRLGNRKPFNNCHLQDIEYGGAHDKLTFPLRHLRIHPFLVNVGFQTNRDWRTNKIKLNVTFESRETEECRFLERLEARIKELLLEIPDLHTIVGPMNRRRTNANALALVAEEHVRRACILKGSENGPIPHLQIMLQCAREQNEVVDKFRFTIRDGSTGRIMTEFLPSAVCETSRQGGDQLLQRGDRLSALVQLDRVVFYPDGASIQLILFQGKLYKRYRSLSLNESFPTADLLDAPAAIVEPSPENDAASVTEEVVEDSQHRHGRCPVCLTENVNVVLNCFHALCRACGDLVTACPVCRTSITNRSPLFLT